MSHYKPYPVYKDSGVEFNNNTAEQALLGDFSKAADAVMDSGAAHHNQMTRDGITVPGSRRRQSAPRPARQRRRSWPA